jgi:hypothetical protein
MASHKLRVPETSPWLHTLNTVFYIELLFSLLVKKKQCFLCFLWHLLYHFSYTCIGFLQCLQSIDRHFEVILSSKECCKLQTSKQFWPVTVKSSVTQLLMWKTGFQIESAPWQTMTAGTTEGRNLTHTQCANDVCICLVMLVLFAPFGSKITYHSMLLS